MVWYSKTLKYIAQTVLPKYFTILLSMEYWVPSIYCVIILSILGRYTEFHLKTLQEVFCKFTVNFTGKIITENFTVKLHLKSPSKYEKLYFEYKITTILRKNLLATYFLVKFVVNFREIFNSKDQLFEFNAELNTFFTLISTMNNGPFADWEVISELFSLKNEWKKETKSHYNFFFRCFSSLIFFFSMRFFSLARKVLISL